MDKRGKVISISGHGLALAAVLLFGAAGAAWGWYWAVYGLAESGRLITNITVHINAIPAAWPADSYRRLLESFIKHGKTIVILWFLSFLPPAIPLTLALVFLKAAAAGFTTGALWAAFNDVGLWYAMALYLPQSLVMAPACIFTAYGSIRAAMGAIRANRIMRSARSERLAARGLFMKKPGLSQYGLYLWIGLFCAGIAAGLEVWAVPRLLAMVR